jgi:nitrile hydratase accessory protein
MTSPGGRAETACLLDSVGPATPPRDNGELVFAAPWESQAFGLALALTESGQIRWEDFRQHLIAEIAAWESSHAPSEEWSYYRCWLTAVERLTGRRGLVGASDLEDRAEALAARPPDHGPPGHRHDGQHDAAPPATHNS